MVICVDFSFCGFAIYPFDFSLKQNITRLVRQPFIPCCELHQVWEPPSITVFIYVARTLWAHALNSEHAQSDLWLPVVGYWLYWFGLDINVQVQLVVGRFQFKPRGVKKMSVSYMIEVVLTNVPI